MHSFKIEIAETVIEVDAIYESSKKLCKDYFTDKPSELQISVTEEDIENERRFATSANPTGPSLEYMALYRMICTVLASREIVLIHGSCIAVDGQAYLFCAPSGTGKSTHTRLWREWLGDRAVMINDDKPLVRIAGESAGTNADPATADGFAPGTAVIYGTPWNGKHGLGANICAPLRNICFLERGEANSIEPIDSSSALPQLLKYTFRPEDPSAMICVLDTATKIADLSAFWSLKCNMSHDAAKTSYTAMSEGLEE